MARAVGDDELALRRLEVAIRHVDGDALLALGLQAVDQQGEIGHFAGGAPAAAVVRDGRELVVEHLARVVQQAADQRALAVVDRAAGDETQQVDLALLREELLQRARRVPPVVGAAGFTGTAAIRNILRACDFPWPPAESASMARLCRSEVVVRSISSMISGTLAAFDTCAPVSG